MRLLNKNETVHYKRKTNDGVVIRIKKVRPEIELKIIQLLAEGFYTKEIADKICLSFHTVVLYRVILLKKYNASNSTHLVSIAYKQGILKP